jgi:hypothetical protein
MARAQQTHQLQGMLNQEHGVFGWNMLSADKSD